MIFQAKIDKIRDFHLDVVESSSLRAVLLFSCGEFSVHRAFSNFMLSDWFSFRRQGALRAIVGAMNNCPSVSGVFIFDILNQSHKDAI